MSGGGRLSIPGSVRRMIQNIKEIAGNHSDEEVYAMLKECAMDPNETTQRLLLQDTFHEVKRKRDKRKENSKEPTESKWRPGVQGRGGRVGRGHFSSRSTANDAGGGRNVSSGKDNGVNQDAEKGTTSTCSPKGQDADMKSMSLIQSSVGSLANGPTKLENPVSSQEDAPLGSSATAAASKEGGSATVNENIRTTLLVSLDVKGGSSHGPSVTDSNQLQLPMKSASVSGVYASASDPVLVPSIDTNTAGAVGTIRREVGGQRIESTVNKLASHDIAGVELSSIPAKGSAEMKNSYPHEKLQGKSQGSEANYLPDAPQDAYSTSLTSSSGSMPSSNYSSRSQQISSQKVGPGKEWKPKSTHANAVQAAGTVGPSDVSSTVETVDQTLSASRSKPSEVTATMLQKKLEELNFSDTRHVIIPNHLQVPESERTGLSFGSFDASFGLGMSSANGVENEKSSTPLSESSHDDEENVEEPPSSSHVASPAAEVAYPDNSRSPLQMPENLSSREENMPSSLSAVSQYDKSKSGAAFPQEGLQYSAVHTSPTYSTFGLVPQMLGGQFQPFDSTESQPRDSARLSGFVVQQPFDPSTNFYTQFYRPADGDGRHSPFLAPGAPTKYDGSIASIPAQTSQSPQEIGNSLALSSGGPAPLATQAAGVMQSSIAVTQQPLPVFRQPGGVPISHYPPNLIPYGQYIPPFYVAPHAIHHFLSNTAFPQQPPTGNIYPPPAAASSATPVKYSVPQQKPGTNTSNSAHVGMPTGYGTYSTSPAGYNPNPSATSGNSTSNEDLAASRYKENNVYATGQQSEGSALWFPTPGRDIAGLPASSFYNFPGQGQHLSFAPTQPSHGAFAGIYHPTQTVAAAGIHPLLQQSQAVAGAVEMVGPSAGIYQQPQRAQINWANN